MLTRAPFYLVAYLLVHSLAVSLNRALFSLNWFAISASRGLSGLGSTSTCRIVIRTVVFEMDVENFAKSRKRRSNNTFWDLKLWTPPFIKYFLLCGN